MKPIHWLNLIGVGLTAALLTFLALHWAITSYADPTCQRYVESKGNTYVGFIPPDSSADVGASRPSRDGTCQYHAPNGDLGTVGLVAAGGTNGAPLLVHFALSWEFIFLASFIGVAFILAMLTRVLKPKQVAP